jgi:hypothetical protein
LQQQYTITLVTCALQGLKEMVRVTKPGGRVVVAGPKAGCGTYAPWMKVLNSGRFPDAQPVPKPAAATFLGSSEGMVKELGEAGLYNVEVLEERVEFRLPDVAATVQGSLGNPFMQAVKEKLTPKRWVEVQEALCAALAASKLDDGSVGFYVTSLIARGEKPVS